MTLLKELLKSNKIMMKKLVIITQSLHLYPQNSIKKTHILSQKICKICVYNRKSGKSGLKKIFLTTKHKKKGG